MKAAPSLRVITSYEHEAVWRLFKRKAVTREKVLDTFTEWCLASFTHASGWCSHALH